MPSDQTSRTQSGEPKSQPRSGFEGTAIERLNPETKIPGADEQVVAHHWDRNAQLWTDAIRAGQDIYRELYNQPAMLEFIGDLRGLEVLDAGCGEGYWTRILARSGARMTGLDLSAQMIELGRAEESRAPLGIRYAIGSYTALDGFGSETFDAVVSFMALMDGPDLSAALREIRRVLKPGGVLIFSILHPAFANRGTHWILDGQARATALQIGEYFNAEPWIDSWKFGEPETGVKRDGWKVWRKLPERWKLWRRLPERWNLRATKSQDTDSLSIPHFSRTLSDYINTVITSGLVLNEIAEPRPSEEACRMHPLLQRHRVHAPLFLYIRTVKGDSNIH